MTDPIRALAVAKAVYYSCELPDGRSQRSENSFEVLGLPATGASSQWTALIHADDQPMVEHALRAVSPDDPRYELQYRMRHGVTGELFWVFDRGEADFDGSGTISRARGLAVEISDRVINETFSKKCGAPGTDSWRPDIGASDTAEEAANRLAAIVASSEDAIISNGLSGVVTTWNNGAERLLGYGAEEMVGQPLLRIVPPGLADDPFTSLRGPSPAEAAGRYETALLRKDGSMVEVSLTLSPIRNAAGNIVGSSIIARDITNRRNLERRQAIVVRELSHRVKNTLAVVQAMSRQMLRTNANPKKFAVAFEGRIRSLAASHSLLTDTDWRGASLSSIIRSQLFGMADDIDKRFILEGADFLLPAEAATQIGLLMHELATNAAKYGALSVATGTVRIAWESEGTKLNLTWCERGGPRIAGRPKRTGFGSALIASTASTVFNSYDPEGLTCKIELAL